MAFEIKHGHGIPFSQKHGLGSQPMGPLVMTDEHTSDSLTSVARLRFMAATGMKIQSVPCSASPYYVIAHLLSLSLVILIGDSATGKSSLMTGLIRNEWNPSITSTISAHLWIKTVHVNSRVVKGNRDSFPLR
jgi:hypothetical protein